MTFNIFTKFFLCFLILSTSVFGQVKKIIIRCDSVASLSPANGRIYFILKTSIEGIGPGTLFYPDYINPDPFYAKDVSLLKAGDTIVLDSNALSFPNPLGKLSKGIFYGQAILDINDTERSFSTSDRNGFSKPVKIDFEKDSIVNIVIDNVFHKKPFTNTKSIKEITIPSRLLSEFYKDSIGINAAVILPPSYGTKKDKYYPTVYIIPAYGGTHYDVLYNNNLYVNNSTVEKIYVVLDAESKYGHHVFADSENNGPRGKSFVEEIIPYVEGHFRVIKKGSARFLEGHSSGGWSSLWLQMNNPDAFGGAWAIAPDPVDFTNFDQVDIYAEKANIFYNGKELRRLERIEGEIKPTYKALSDKEIVVGNGEQLGSFEAVFGPKGSDGEPVKLWDRTTGDVNKEVAENWRKYDISYILINNWTKLRAKLANKLNIFVGSKDEFYLDESVAVLKDKLKQKGDAVNMVIFKDHNHFSIYDDSNIHKRVNKEIETLLKNK